MLSQDEFELLINDPSKFINGDILWNDDTNHYPSCKFRINIEADIDYQIMMIGTYNAQMERLSYTIIHKPSGKRIYGLDLGWEVNHKNPDGKMLGEPHKHRWQVPYQDKIAYRPLDITAKASQPIEVWDQFCEEAKIKHLGNMNSPPLYQPDILI